MLPQVRRSPGLRRRDGEPHRAGRRRTQDPQALGIVGVGVIVQRLIPAQLENFGREKDALRVPLAPIQLDDESHE